ncbi:hypothetical protein L873DRAFT_573870 [Choiromyces venosus 120613-1]|uniref:Uncharacterized protein n=1 Tax=Choiromyces venosus 120613-1 TaxID=1336337 RepID=A0A3N4JYB9_9PEZI|nr:hypothetical protein L873DRAFT_573870 [Choiromyces venosus 120613-1]
MNRPFLFPLFPTVIPLVVYPSPSALKKKLGDNMTSFSQNTLASKRVQLTSRVEFNCLFGGCFFVHVSENFRRQGELKEDHLCQLTTRSPEFDRLGGA